MVMEVEVVVVGVDAAVVSEEDLAEAAIENHLGIEAVLEVAVTEAVLVVVVEAADVVVGAVEEAEEVAVGAWEEEKLLLLNHTGTKEFLLLGAKKTR